MRNKAARHQIFYVPPEDSQTDLIAFSPEESRHMLASLRLAAGDPVTATDGSGCVLSVRIEEVTGERVVGRVLARATRQAPGPAIWVFQGSIKPARMDLVVEKCVELGIAGLVAVDCERCLRRDTGARLERWRRVAIEAMKQSLQSRLPEIAWSAGLPEALGKAGQLGKALLASGGSEHPRLRDVLAGRPPASLCIWVGPEGGFTDVEVAQLVEAGAVAFNLGSSRLRSETAAIAAVSAVRAILG